LLKSAEIGTAVTGKPVSEMDRRREAIRQYFGARQKMVKSMATTHSRRGTTFDWVPADPKDMEGAPILAEKTTSPPGAQLAVTELDEEPDVRGPDGTVPIVRFNVEAFLKNNPDNLPADPAQVLQKLPPPSPDGTGRYHITAEVDNTAFGSDGYINIWDAGGPQLHNETDIAQTFVGRGLDSVEIGKIESPDLNGGSSAPFLFTFFTTTGHTTQGNWQGSYNQQFCGWKQISTTVAPGAAFASNVSVFNGNQVDYRVTILRGGTSPTTPGDWFVFFNGSVIGKYPSSRFNDPATGCMGSGDLFGSSGMKLNASRALFYGEVFDASAPLFTTTDMGSGAFASGGWQHAAYFRNIAWYNSLTSAFFFPAGSTASTDSACYTGTNVFTSSDPNWKAWFFHGGPGGDIFINPVCK